ncbi:MAG: hypothetical protein JKX78_02010 [Alteromonadaceae bacterium]|nr:hypothetical protein [Alteromonadaceae bacterium]
MMFNRHIKYFLTRHILLFFFVALMVLNYFILGGPDTWTHQDTYIKRLIGYYAAPVMMLIFGAYFLYEWFKYKVIYVNFNDKYIKLNHHLIDISKVKNICCRYIKKVDSYEYIFYEVIPLEYRKLVTIPMFLIPENKDKFKYQLISYCEQNNIKLDNITS